MSDTGSMTLALVHIFSVMIAIGGNVFFIWIFSPVAQKHLSQDDYLKVVAHVIRKFHPLELLCYGVALVTGAWMITRYKIMSGVNFFHEYGAALGWKLVLVFFVMMVACGKFFGVGTGLVYAVDEKLETQNLPKKINLLRMLSFLNLILLLVTVYLGLRITRI